MELYSRKLFLLPYKNEAPFQATTMHQNTTSTSPTLLSPTTAPPRLPEEHHSNHAHPFDSTMALTVLLVLTALFFMAFFSIYIRRFSNNELFSRSHNDSQNTARSPRATVGRKGLDPEVVNSLPVYSYYGGDGKYRINDECPICLGEFEEQENVKEIPSCGHVFHSGCIDTWLGMHVTCPVCRGTQFVESGRKKEVSERGRSTVEICLELKELGVRRTSSCSSLGTRMVSLARTSSV